MSSWALEIPLRSFLAMSLTSASETLPSLFLSAVRHAARMKRLKRPSACEDAAIHFCISSSEPNWMKSFRPSRSSMERQLLACSFSLSWCPGGVICLMTPAYFCSLPLLWYQRLPSLRRVTLAERHSRTDVKADLKSLVIWLSVERLLRMKTSPSMIFATSEGSILPVFALRCPLVKRVFGKTPCGSRLSAFRHRLCSMPGYPHGDVPCIYDRKAGQAASHKLSGRGRDWGASGCGELWADVRSARGQPQGTDATH
mmetsp:Transcript_37503/g.105900  ORF Transcript_37503/g.105900 Transcript_37503/m.105900 type:complete len:256 (+) Transcript_37503:677-1444(+)